MPSRKNKVDVVFEEYVSALEQYFDQRLLPPDRLLLDRFAGELGISSIRGLYGTMLLDSRTGINHPQLTFNPFRTVFVQLFFDKAQTDHSLYNEQWKEIFYRLQRGYVIYRLSFVTSHDELEEFRDRLEEAYLRFSDPFIDAEFLSEIDDMIDDIRNL